jgi:TPP-dependent pyruvate/acetoin dehydrogenase alpha subunit
MQEKTNLFFELYRRMLRIRIFESEVSELFKRQKIFGAVHLYLGQEAVAVGVCSALTEQDYVTSTHRGHGHVIAKGGDLNRMMAELFARETGYSGGRGGSMHIADTSLNILGANGIVGGGIALATGAALSAKLRGTKQVAVSFFGDGASNQGSFHESLNMAGTDELPVIYVCENNLYGVFTAQTKVRAVESIAERAHSYGFPGVMVNGNDVLAVYEAAFAAVERARTGCGPTLIEAQTYRHHGHFEGDVFPYRPKEEESCWIKRDPIETWENRMKREFHIANDVELSEIRTQVEEEVKKAIEFAEESPWPKPENACTGVYQEEVEP